MNLKKLERYLPVNLFGPGPRLVKKRIYRAAVSQRLRNTGKGNLGRWLSVSTFCHFPRRTAFLQTPVSISFLKQSPQQRQVSLQYVGRTKRAILLQFSGTANRNFITLPINPKFCFAASSTQYTSQVCKFTDKILTPHRLVALVDGYDQHNTQTEQQPSTNRSVLKIPLQCVELPQIFTH